MIQGLVIWFIVVIAHAIGRSSVPPKVDEVIEVREVIRHTVECVTAEERYILDVDQLYMNKGSRYAIDIVRRAHHESVQRLVRQITPLIETRIVPHGGHNIVIENKLVVMPPREWGVAVHPEVEWTMPGGIIEEHVVPYIQQPLREKNEPIRTTNMG